jgi:tyrosine phenol-lyase
MSDRQWAGMMLGDEAYAGSRNFYHLEEAVQSVYGYKLPDPHAPGTRRGAPDQPRRDQARPVRARQHVLHDDAPAPGVGRRHRSSTSSSTRPTIPTTCDPFKGNMDLTSSGCRSTPGAADGVPYVSSRGHGEHGRRPAGQHGERPALRGLLRRPRMKLYLDATRAGRERPVHPAARGGLRRQVDRRHREGVLLLHRRGVDERQEGSTWSTSAAGWRSTTRSCLRRLRNWWWSSRGCTPTAVWPGATWRRWPSAFASRVQDDHIRSRVGQVRYLGELLTEWGVPIVQPVGGHAIFLEREAPSIRMCRRIEFPAQTLAARALPRLRHPRDGARRRQRGRDPATGDHYYPKLELTRLTIPRRVYTQAHMDVVAESVKAVYDARETRVWAEDGLRAEVSALLPGAVRASVGNAANPAWRHLCLQAGFFDKFNLNVTGGAGDKGCLVARHQEFDWAAGHPPYASRPGLLRPTQRRTAGR